MGKSEERIGSLEVQVRELKAVVGTLQSRLLIGNSTSNADQVSGYGPVSGIFGGRVLVLTDVNDQIVFQIQSFANPVGTAPGGAIVDSLNVTINGVARKIALY